MESLNSFKIAQEQVEIVRRYLQVDPGVLEMLKQTKNKIWGQILIIDIFEYSNN